jgi:hypothetical protein
LIVESFVSGDEFTAHYSISKGRSRLSMIDNRYGVAVHDGAVTTVPAARVYPSTFTAEYLAQVDPAMRRLCDHLGVVNGVLFVQGIYDSSNSRFAVFEGGLRPAGEATWRLVEQANGCSPLHLLADQCLLGNAQYDVAREDPYLRGAVGAVISLVGRGGRVGGIRGICEAVREAEGVFDWENRDPVGSMVPDGDGLHQLMVRFFVLAKSMKSLRSDINVINQNVRVVDELGLEMCQYFDPSRLPREICWSHRRVVVPSDVVVNAQRCDQAGSDLSESN